MDYYLHVNPAAKHNGMLLVFNPHDREITKTINLPLCYTGLTGSAKIRQQEGSAKTVSLDGMANAKLPVTLPPGGFSRFVIV